MVDVERNMQKAGDPHAPRAGRAPTQALRIRPPRTPRAPRHKPCLGGRGDGSPTPPTILRRLAAVAPVATSDLEGPGKCGQMQRSDANLRTISRRLDACLTQTLPDPSATSIWVARCMHWRRAACSAHLRAHSSLVRCVCAEHAALDYPATSAWVHAAGHLPRARWLMGREVHLVDILRRWTQHLQTMNEQHGLTTVRARASRFVSVWATMKHSALTSPNPKTTSDGGVSQHSGHTPTTGFPKIRAHRTKALINVVGSDIGTLPPSSLDGGSPWICEIPCRCHTLTAARANNRLALVTVSAALADRRSLGAITQHADHSCSHFAHYKRI